MVTKTLLLRRFTVATKICKSTYRVPLMTRHSQVYEMTINVHE